MSLKTLENSVVITGASVTGKTTLSRRLMVHYMTEALPIDMTRKPRDGEIENVDGIFISEAQFKSNFNQKKYLQDSLESCYFGGYYSGCPKQWVDSAKSGDFRIFVCPTVKTARELKQILGEKIFWVHLTTNSEIRRERLLKRNPNIDMKDFELRIQRGDAPVDLSGNDLVIDTSYLNAWEIFFHALARLSICAG